jgi:membrane protein DedA with SNARE-associated domain
MKFTLVHYLTQNTSLGYVALFLGMILEGDLILFAAGFLSQQGVFTLPIMLSVAFVGVLFGDALWYRAGVLLKVRAKRVEVLVGKIARPFDYHLEKRPFRTIFISKFIYGLHHAILMRAGMLHIPFRKYLKIDIVSTLIWGAVVAGLGYFSSISFTENRHELRSVEIKLLLGILAFFVISEVISKILKRGL